MSMTLKELRDSSDDKLIVEHDRIAKNTGVGIAYYLEELTRRDAATANKTMVDVTKAIAWMTVVITIATIINLVAVLV
jgi:hypothetical protein